MYEVSQDIAFGGFGEREMIDDGAWRVVNVSSTELSENAAFHPLNDGAYDGGNTQEAFDAAVDAVRDGLGSTDPVFVHCAVGQSRSVAVLATALAAENGRTFESLKRELMEIRGSFTEPATSLQDKAQEYLNQ